MDSYKDCNTHVYIEGETMSLSQYALIGVYIEEENAIKEEIRMRIW